jgi:hypothetical protein
MINSRMGLLLMESWRKSIYGELELSEFSAKSPPLTN